MLTSASKMGSLMQLLVIIQSGIHLIFAQQTSTPISSTTNATAEVTVAPDYVTVNWSLATQTGDFHETVYYPPYYADFSPCPCDLTPKSCDRFCCCDSQCDRRIQATIIDYCNGSMQLISEQINYDNALDQFSDHLGLFLEQYYVTTPYLGHYYINVPTSARTASAFTELIATSVATDSSNFSSPEIGQWETLINSYSKSTIGSVVRTQNYYESLPTPTLLDRSCTYRSPVLFLHDSNVTCVKLVTPQSCTNDPDLNPASYLHSDIDMDLGMLPTNPSPIDNSTANDTVTEPPPAWSNMGTRTVYKCRAIPTNPWDNPKPDCQLINDPQQITSPTFQSKNNMCLGIVAAVLYKFYWSGHRMMNASEIIIIDQPINEEVMQIFSVIWTHRVSDTVASNTSLPKRRMWTGYVWDDVIYGTANILFNNTIGQTSASSTVKSIPVLKSLPNNQCPSFEPGTKFEPLKFGPNLETGCHLSLNKDQFRDCSGLRRTIVDIWKTLFQDIVFLPKFTYDSLPRDQSDQILFRADDIVQVLRQVFSEDTTTAIPTTLGTTTMASISTQAITQIGSINVENSTANQSDTVITTTVPNMDTTTASILPTSTQETTQNELIHDLNSTANVPSSTSTEATQFDSIDTENLTDTLLDEISRSVHTKNVPQKRAIDQKRLLPFTCDLIPTNARLDIMYAEAGYVNGTYLNVIVGAQLSFKYSKWRYSNRLGPVQNFFLGQSVRFIKVPVIEPEPVKKYYLTERRDHCPSAITCWDELFYPFLDLFPVETYRYTQAVGLATIIGFVGVYLVSRPWW